MENEYIVKGIDSTGTVIRVDHPIGKNELEWAVSAMEDCEVIVRIVVDIALPRD